MIKTLLLSGGDNSGAAEEGFIGTSRGDSGGGRELDKAAKLQGPPQTAGDANTNNARIAQKKQRLYFLDNLRSFLTAVVVVHHVVCQVGGNGLSGTVNLLVCTTSQAKYGKDPSQNSISQPLKIGCCCCFCTDGGAFLNRLNAPCLHFLPWQTLTLRCF
jgi:hypothetical protein